MKTSLSAMTGMPVNINIEEIKKPELDAKLVGQSIAQQLEKRIQFRRAMKRGIPKDLHQLQHPLSRSDQRQA
ncbi:hypothetical protein THIOSC13_1930003 [uncultured Thiomicrorhabdus sp.]